MQVLSNLHLWERRSWEGGSIPQTWPGKDVDEGSVWRAEEGFFLGKRTKVEQRHLGASPDQWGAEMVLTHRVSSPSFLLVCVIDFQALPHIIFLLSGSKVGLEMATNQRLGPQSMSACLCAGISPPRASTTPRDRTTERQHTPLLRCYCKSRAPTACPLAGLGPKLTRASACPPWSSLS